MSRLSKLLGPAEKAPLRGKSGGPGISVEDRLRRIAPVIIDACLDSRPLVIREVAADLFGDRSACCTGTILASGIGLPGREKIGAGLCAIARGGLPLAGRTWL